MQEIFLYVVLFSVFYLPASVVFVGSSFCAHHLSERQITCVQIVAHVLMAVSFVMMGAWTFISIRISDALGFDKDGPNYFLWALTMIPLIVGSAVYFAVTTRSSFVTLMCLAAGTPTLHPSILKDEQLIEHRLMIWYVLTAAVVIAWGVCERRASRRQSTASDVVEDSNAVK